MNIMNKKVLILTASLLSFSGVYAETAEVSSSAPKEAETTGVLSKEILKNFSADISLGYESMYVFRGIALANSSIQPSVELGYKIFEGAKIYGGFWNSTALKSDETFEVDLYGGVQYEISSFTFDVGYTYYLYPSDSFHTNEIKAGVSYDTSEILGDFNISPSVYYYYDFNLEQNYVEVALSHSSPISKWMFGKEYLSWENSVFGGYSKYEDGSYGYAGVSSSLALKLMDNLSVSAGIRYAWNSYSKDELLLGSNSNLWFGTSINVSF